MLSKEFQQYIDRQNQASLKTKKKFAKELQITEQCLHSYHNIACGFHDFLNDYPKEDGVFITKVALTEYQQWVINQLLEHKNKGASKDMLIMIEPIVCRFAYSNREKKSVETKPNYVVFTNVTWS